MRRASASAPDVPLVPMTYAAIVERYGVERFCADAAAAGATGLIVADIPPEEAGELEGAAPHERDRPRAPRIAHEP